MSKLIPYGRNDLFNNIFVDFDHFIPSTTTTFRLDIEDKGDAYEITADLPGVKKEEVALNLSNESLTISVKRTEEQTDNNTDKKYIRRERRFLNMARSIYLPYTEKEDIKAKMEDGVLSITVLKRAKNNDSGSIAIE
jgi:HSP20 family protein